MRDVPRHLYPFEHNYLDLGGVKYHYLDEGPNDGEPVLMVHGNPTWSFYYRNLIQSLRDEYRCVAPDHVGCGYSDKPGDDRYEYTFERRVDDLTRLVDELGLERINLVVHDWGGMIGMTWATRHPDRVSRLVVLNTASFHLPGGKSFPWQLWLTRTPVGTVLVRGANAFSRAATRVCCTRRPLTKEVRDAYAAPYDSWNDRIATLRFVQDIPLSQSDKGYQLISEVDGDLHKLKDKPMLIGWGDKDFVFDHHFLAEWEKRFPQAEVHRWADCGHYVLEDAWVDLEPLIKAHLKKPADPAAAVA